MISDINFLLVGNSRLHWAKYSKNQSKFFHTKKGQKVRENIDLDQLIWASVGDWHSSNPDGIETKGRDTRFGGVKQECGIHVNDYQTFHNPT